MSSGSRTPLPRNSKNSDNHGKKQKDSAVSSPFHDGGECSKSATDPSTSKKYDRKAKDRVHKRVAIQWLSDETNVFYDALKEISTWLEKKKFTRDKDQAKNFYYNTYKIYKEKTAISDDEWDGVPYGARELLIVINALEWKKRTNNANIQTNKFRSLVLNGSTVIKLPQKKTSVTLKTPYCRAFQKYFPSLKQCAQVPLTLNLFLMPYTYDSKYYVNNMCDMNPILNITIPSSASVTQLFEFIEQKWRYYEGEVEMGSPTIKIHLPEDFKPTIVEITLAEDAVPCLEFLKKSRDRNESTHIEYLEFNSLYEGGLSRSNIKDMNMTQLFFFFNESHNITLRYEIEYANDDMNCFEKLAELFGEYEDMFADLRLDKRLKDMTDAVKDAPPVKRQPNKRMAELVKNQEQQSVVDIERNNFMQQLEMLRKNSKPSNRKPRILKKPKPSSCSTPSTSSAPPTDFGPLRWGQNVTVQYGNSYEQMPSTSQPQFPVVIQMPMEYVNQPADAEGEVRYSNLEPMHPEAQNTLDEIFNTPIQADFASPSKSLMNEAFNLFDTMENVNSVDFISNFAQLADHFNESQSQFNI
ncbi:unnamed protein product [Bursaphelenchus okinawaensis]|uniref:Uncharacterized protein n=1 Tax=Bursaphelenchus okinawaensis TaxID=465554 RepID=A0A811KJL1_9BILA|nr:unnamed protein product [Bursaphelenchus okinawaensis]CAG9104170.1 unnamed protein product [Bursaphelenchus okinawaensis]